MSKTKGSESLVQSSLKVYCKGKSKAKTKENEGLRQTMLEFRTKVRRVHTKACKLLRQRV